MDRKSALLIGRTPSRHVVFSLQPAAAWLLLLFCVGQSGCAQGQSSTANGTTVNQSSSKTADSVSWTRVAGEDWPSFLGPRGDGTSAETGVDPQLWQPHPPIVWTLPLAVGYSAPTLVDGKMLLFERFGEAERLTCYVAETAEELWRCQAAVQYDDMYGYNNGPRCYPIVDEDRVYTYGVAGRLSCIDLNTGEQIWTKDTADEYGVIPNFFGVASTPVVDGNVLWVMVGGSPEESSRLPPGRLDRVVPNGSAIVGFDKTTGEELYRLGDDLASYASLTVRKIDGQQTGLAFLRSGLMAWDPNTGEEKFTFPWRAPMLESVNAALPVTSGNQILLSEAYEVGSVLLDASSQPPEVVWQDSGPRNRCSFRAHWSTPVVVDGYLYGCNGRNQPDSDFRCVRLSDGEVMWFDRRHERSSVLVIDDFLIVLGEYGNLELLRPSPEGLEVLKSVDLSEIEAEDGGPLLSYPCWSAPIVSHGLMFVRGNDRLVCFDLIPEKAGK